MRIIPDPILQGLFSIEADIIGDSRGYFMEVYRKDKCAEAELVLPELVQQNVSFSQNGVVRGLHFQWDKPLGKLIRVLRGEAFAVAVDIRKKSSTLGKWRSFTLTAENKRQIYLPPGFAFGFCVTGDVTELEYHYTALWNPHGESNIIWNDPDIAITWPLQDPILSERDKAAKSFQEWLRRPESDLF